MIGDSDKTTVIIADKYTATIKRTFFYNKDNGRYDNKRIISYKVHIGGNHKRCIELILPGKEEHKSEFGYLSRIAYNEDCIQFDKLVSGTGTHHLIKTSMAFVKRNTPWVKYLKFTDTSKKVCDKGKISLFSFFIAFNGKTWYETYYNAYIEDIYTRQEYYNCLERVKSNELKQTNESYWVNLIEPTVLKTLFSTSNNLAHFFRIIKCVYTKPSEQCDLCISWLERFINIAVFDNKMEKYSWNWVIELAKVETPTIPRLSKAPAEYNYELVDINGGGSKKNKNWSCLLGSIDKIIHRNRGNYIEIDYDW